MLFREERQQFLIVLVWANEHGTLLVAIAFDPPFAGFDALWTELKAIRQCDVHGRLAVADAVDVFEAARFQPR